MKAVCISASNILKSNCESTSYMLSEKVKNALATNGVSCEILDLRKYNLSPCVGCGLCFESKRTSLCAYTGKAMHVAGENGGNYVSSLFDEAEGIFPVQQYDWETIDEKIQAYVRCVVQAIQ